MGCCCEKQSTQKTFIQFAENRLLFWLDLYALNMGNYGPKRPKCGYWSDQTDRKLGIGQTKKTEGWVLTRQNSPKCGYWSDKTDQTVGTGQRPNRHKMGTGQNEQTKNCHWPDGRCDQIFFPDH